MNLMNVPGILVCSSFLISVCMFIVSKTLLISSATAIVRTRGAIWLNPFATVLFNVCSAVTVECCVLYLCCVGVFGYVCCYVRKKALLQCLQLLRGRIWVCMRCPCLCLCCVLGWGLCIICIMLELRAVFNMLMRNASPRGFMCFRFLMFNLSGPCELLFLLHFITSWTCVVVSVMLYPCILCVNGSVLSCVLRV